MPDILSQAGYSFKNPIQQTKSSAAKEYSSSESPDNINMQAELSWNSLDFNLGYASYKMQKAKSQMVALEEKE